jgi:uncharacterized protein YerC
MPKANGKMMDAVLVGSVEWTKARTAAIEMTAKLQGEVDELQSLLKMQDAYSPIAWLNVCQQLRVVTDGMIVMRMLAEGKTSGQITAETGILPGSIAAYKAWNTMYADSIKRGVQKRIKIRGRTKAEQAADISFLQACGIAFDLQPRAEADVE